MGRSDHSVLSSITASHLTIKTGVTAGSAARARGFEIQHKRPHRDDGCSSELRF